MLLMSATEPRVLLVGAFPHPTAKRVYGGQVSVCTRLLQSKFVETFAVRTVDSTQVSNPPPSLPLRGILALWRLVQFSVELVLHRPDAVLLFLARGASVYEKGAMTWLSGLLGIPVLVFPRAGGLIQDYFASAMHASFVRRTLGRARFFLCQGRTFQEFAISELGFDPTHAPIIPNWTALRTHLEIGEKRAPGLDRPIPRVLFLGWLEEPKGVFELLQSALTLKQRDIPVHVTFAGNGSALPAAIEFVERNGLHDRIAFAGWVDDDAKTALLNESDIFVLPSWSEGLPNAMIEAMSAGLACILTEVGMIPDYVVHGRHGLLVPPRDVDALTQALTQLVANPALRGEVARQGHLLAAAQFSLDNGAAMLSEAVLAAIVRR